MLIPNKYTGYAHDGVRRCHIDVGGGGGSGPSTTTTTNVPEYARPYFEDLLGKTQALTATPTQQYTGERIAGFTPLQQQAFETAGNLKTGPDAFAEQVPQYMSPYQQNVIDIQKREAGRQSDIQGQKQQAQATQAGAFGGYREGIERAERERNLGTQMDDIQAKGSQDAFDRATAQYNTGMKQAQDVAGMQQQFGGQQQTVQQNYLTQQYQDFVNQQNAPYKQLGFMSDVLHGVPGTQSAAQVYQPAPSAISQAAGLGTLAYGLNKKNGGVVDVEARFADGGAVGADPNVYEMASMASEMSDAQLQQALKTRPNDPALLAEVARRQRMRASGLAALPAASAEYASGGIVAFADGGVTEDTRPQFIQDVARIPSLYEKWWLDNRTEDAKKAAAEKQTAEQRAEQNEAGRKGSFFNYMFGEPSSSRKAAQTQKAQDAPAAVVGPDTGDETARLLKRYPQPLESPVTPQTEAPVQDTAGLTALVTGSRRGARFKPNTMDEAIAQRDSAAEASNADTDAAYAPFKDMLSKEREDLEGRKEGNVKDALVRAGLGMLSGTSPHAAVNIGQGGIQGLDAYQKAKAADDAALKANTTAQMTAMQALRAERSGNLRDATALRNQVRQEEQVAAQLELQAEQLRVQAFIANKTPAEIQMAERIAKEKKIPFSEALQFLYGARQEPKNEAALRAQWSKDIMLRTQYPDFEDYARIMGASGGTSGLSAADAALVNKYSK